jgi:hypothetical protein
MSKMIIARGDVTDDKPIIYEATVPSDTFRLFKADRAWTTVSFGKRILTVALPGSIDQRGKIEADWVMVRSMIAKSPRLFDSMVREFPKRYVSK